LDDTMGEPEASLGYSRGDEARRVFVPFLTMARPVVPPW